MAHQQKSKENNDKYGSSDLKRGRLRIKPELHNPRLKGAAIFYSFAKTKMPIVSSRVVGVAGGAVV